MEELMRGEEVMKREEVMTREEVLTEVGTSVVVRGSLGGTRSAPSSSTKRNLLRSWKVKVTPGKTLD